MKYKSRVSIWFYLLLCACAGLGILGAVLYFRSREAVLFCIMLFGWLDVALLLPLLFTTHYTLTDQVLRVRCAYLVREDIPLRCLKLVRDARDFTFGPALSFDRIEIRYRIAGKDGRMLLSPKEKKNFVDALCARAKCAFNPEEEV